MRLVLSALVLFGYCAVARSAEVWLADGGRSDYRIVIAAQAPASTRYAAEELQRFFAKISGARLPIASDAEPATEHEILLGQSQRLDALRLKLDIAALGREGYTLRTVGKRLAIVGGAPRGTLYGVYGLLEDHFGCRWFTPEVERIPQASRVPLPELSEQKGPAFEYRETYLWESFDGNWMARNRLNGIGGRGRAADRWGVHSPAPQIDARHGGGIRFGSGFFVHTMELIMPKERYFAAHPEYYALRNGKRAPTQLCCTNDDVIRLCTQAVATAMREQPDATVFSLSQNDNRDYCQCEKCQALATAEESQMAPVLHLVNRVAEAVEQEFPDRVLETLAYLYTRKAPQSMRPRANVAIRLCDIECCFAHPLASGCSSRNEAFVADLQAWAKVCNRLWIWDYVTDFRNYLLPFPNKRVLDDNLRLFAANHVTGVFEQDTWNTPDSELAALGGYLMAKLLWDPNYGEHRAINEFLDAYYGPAAWPVRQYLDLLHDYAEGQQIHCGCYTAVSSKHLTTPLLQAADRLWNEAERRAAGDPATLARVQMSRMSVDYAIVERAREGLKVPEPRRGPEMRAGIDLARTRVASFLSTLDRSPLTRLSEHDKPTKAEYRLAVATDLGVPVDQSLRAEAHRKAQEFIEHETQFHLGVLPTEQSHPKTVGLAETAAKDLPAAIRMLQAVDGDVAPKAAQVFASPQYRKLVAAMQAAIGSGGRVCFSGCGATGRLSILLEAAWRRGCQELRETHRAQAAELAALEDRVVSIMTGGDYALIRSVENFEDHAVFGRRQVQELRLGRGDVLVAISEGGETSSVIGTIGQALDNQAAVFFLFNNPAAVLAKHIERSRQVIENPQVTVLDLSTGPMAVAGSTRMQATTTELLVAGAALETAFAAAVRQRCGLALAAPSDYAAQFEQLRDDLARPEAVTALAAMVAYEEQLYRRKGLVTYLADECLLDIFTDTTERSPTFMLPRFRKCDDQVSPPSWAFVKSLLYATPEAWRAVLRRGPRCLTWTVDDYRQMSAPASLQTNPPLLAAAEMFKFAIGNEDDPARRKPNASAAILIALDTEVTRLRAPFAGAAKSYAQQAALVLGPTTPAADLAPLVWQVPVRRWNSPLGLGDRLAVKLALNTVSTATMARLGRLASNWMAHVEPTNKKLIDRGTRLVAEIAGVDYKTACYALHETIEELARTTAAGQEKPSPVAITIARLKRKP